jgi:type VI secretion system secreted protein VgrG
MDYVQKEDRNLYLVTPLDENLLLLNEFTGHEALSQLFSFHLTVLAKPKTKIEFEKLIYGPVSFGTLGGFLGAGDRHFSGVAVHVAQGATLDDFTHYEITVVPEVIAKTKLIRNRIYQHYSVPEILEMIFSGYDVEFQIVGKFEKRNYCTQYQESDFDFASRLMEEEGIYYYFKFPKRGIHKMVIANTPPSHDDLPGGKTSVLFDPVHGGHRDEERIDHWHKAQTWTSGGYLVYDHHFQLPGRNLWAFQPVMQSPVSVGNVNHQLNLHNMGENIYEFPGRYAYRFDGINKTGGEQPEELQKIFTDNKRTAGIRMEQTEALALLISGTGNHRMFTAGHKFELMRGTTADGKYVILSVSHEASEGSFRSGKFHHSPSYRNAFTCLPSTLPYRPQRTRALPRIAGPVSGVVVGPEGEEIFTDKYGRVKVQMHWDMQDWINQGVTNHDASCWMQVATPWAGQNWGSIHIPRIGQEVLVSFFEGDPDHPVVMGSVYNPDNMPPYKLPDHKTVSTLKSRSTMKGGQSNFNELRFEDLKGKEQVFFHAERDMDERVKAESREWVGANRNLLVHANQKEHVGRGKHSNVNANYVFATGGDKHIQTKGNIYEKIGGDHEWTLTGNNTDQIKGDTAVTVNGNHLEKVDGKVSLTVGKSLEEKTGTKFAHEAGQEIHLKAGQKVVIEAGAELTLKVGGNFIDISSAGITILGSRVNINSGGAAGSGSGSSPDTPALPETEIKNPVPPDHADDGTKFDRM